MFIRYVLLKLYKVTMAQYSTVDHCAFLALDSSPLVVRAFLKAHVSTVSNKLRRVSARYSHVAVALLDVTGRS